MRLPSIDENDPHQVASRGVWVQVLDQPTYSSREICDALGLSAVSPDDVASELRRTGRLFGIWDGERYRHPTWQVTDGRLHERLVELLSVLPGDRGGWRRALWLWFPNELLEDRAPSDVWRSNPGRVIEAAREEFG